MASRGLGGLRGGIRDCCYVCCLLVVVVFCGQRGKERGMYIEKNRREKRGNGGVSRWKLSCNSHGWLVDGLIDTRVP